MALITLQEAIAWIGLDQGVFEITAANDNLILTSDQGTVTIALTHGSYEGEDLAKELQGRLNENDTLTGAVITFSVSYNETSRKFTIDAGSGHTISFTAVGSDGGFTLGFSEDQGAAQEITSDVPCGPPVTNLQRIVDTVDQEIKTYCRRDLESTNYVEYLDGNGERILWLPNYPVTELRKVSIVDSAILISNGSSDMFHYRFAVSQTALTLEIVGGSNQGTDVLSFTTYPTAASLDVAINGLGKGWSSTLIKDCPSTELIETVGTAHSYHSYIQYAGDPDIMYELNPVTGALYRYHWPMGIRNIRTDFTAGYATIPDDLKTAALIFAEWLFARKTEESFGLTSYSVGGVSKTFAGVIPPSVMEFLDGYQRKLVA